MKFVVIIFSLLQFSTYSQIHKCDSLREYYWDQTNNCIRELFAKNDVNKKEFKLSFEYYFTSNKLVKDSDDKGEFYKNILLTIINDFDSFPPVKLSNYVIRTYKGLGFDFQDIKEYKQLNCFKENYIQYEKRCSNDTTSNFYVLGGIANEINSKKRIHCSLTAYTIDLLLSKKELSDKLVQDFIALYFWIILVAEFGE